MILSCQNIRKAFGTDVILKNASFHIEDREKAAVVGTPGSGFGKNGEGYFRLTAFASEEATAEAAERMERLLG